MVVELAWVGVSHGVGSRMVGYVRCLVRSVEMVGGFALLHRITCSALSPCWMEGFRPRLGRLQRSFLGLCKFPGSRIAYQSPVSLLFAACMSVVTGMRSFSVKPRRRMTVMLARQLWQPVSAMAESRMDFDCWLTGLNPSAV